MKLSNKNASENTFLKSLCLRLGLPLIKLDGFGLKLEFPQIVFIQRINSWNSLWKHQAQMWLTFKFQAQKDQILMALPRPKV